MQLAMHTQQCFGLLAYTTAGDFGPSKPTALQTRQSILQGQHLVALHCCWTICSLHHISAVELPSSLLVDDIWHGCRDENVALQPQHLIYCDGLACMWREVRQLHARGLQCTRRLSGTNCQNSKQDMWSQTCSPALVSCFIFRPLDLTSRKSEYKGLPPGKVLR